jgi:hypothetical protein
METFSSEELVYEVPDLEYQPIPLPSYIIFFGCSLRSDLCLALRLK